MEVDARDRLIEVASQLAVVQAIIGSDNEGWIDAAYGILRECIAEIRAIAEDKSVKAGKVVAMQSQKYS